MSFFKTSIVAAIVLAAGSVSAQDVLAIRAGRIITGVTPDIESGVIIVKQGKIVEVGKEKDVKAPWNARVVSFPDGVVTPGFIACHSSMGLRSTNESLPEVPYVTVLDGVDPSAPSFDNALRDGITAVHVVPGNSTRIGGQAAVLRPVGATVDEMLIKSPSAIKISLSPSSGDNLITHMASLRNTFLGLYRELEALAPKEASDEPIPESAAGDAKLATLLIPRPNWKEIAFDKIPADKIDSKREPLVKLVKGEIPAFIYCPRAADVFKAFELMDVHGIAATLVLGADAYKAASVLAAREGLGPVVLAPDLEVRDRDPDSGKERLFKIGKILHDAGVRFAVTAATRRSSRAGPAIFSTGGAYHLWYQAATLVRQGVPRDEAIRAITLNPARVVGLDHRLGSIENGKDASFSVFTGNPLDVRSWVDRVFIEGKEVYNRATDKELSELLREPPATAKLEAKPAENGGEK